MPSFAGNERDTPFQADASPSVSLHQKLQYQIQSFLGTEEFVDDIRRDLKERPSFVYDITIQELIDAVSSVKDPVLSIPLPIM